MREESPAPPHVPDYELLREIGRGSYGVVWLARSVTGQYRAVKIVWRASFEEPQPYEREFRGIKEFAAISVGTPRQLALLHVGRNDAAGFFYYIMELADDVESGREIDPARYRPNTLKDVRLRRQRLPAPEAIALGVELAEGLAELHRHGLVHRDIKPSNIIFAGGAPKLADLGLIASTRASEMTMSMVGNAGYMPPDFPGTPSADVYGLGKVLYELVTGRKRDDFPALPGELASFPDRKELLELNEIYVRACAPNPEKRYANASLLRDDLLLLQAGKSVRRLRAAERHLARALKAAAILTIAAGVAGTAAWLATREARKEMQLRAEAERQRDELARKSVYVATLAQAQRALEQNDFGRASQLLDAIKPADGHRDWRGFEWHALRKAAEGDSSTVIRGTGAAIQKLALSPDNRLLAVHDANNVLTVYSTEKFTQVLRMDKVLRLAGFSPEGVWLVGSVSAARDGKFFPALQRWHIPDGKPDNPLFPPGGYRMLGARRNGQVITFDEAVFPRKGPTVCIWDFNTRREISNIALDDGAATPGWRFFRGTASPEGDEVMVAMMCGQTPDIEYRITRLALGEKPTLMHTVPLTRPGVLGFLTQADKQLAWTADLSRGEIAVFNPTLNEWRRAEKELPVASVIASLPVANGPPVIAAVQNSTIALLGAEQIQEPLARAHAHAAPIVDLVAMNDGTRLFSASGDGEVRAWDSARLFRNRSKRQGWDIRNTHTPIAYSSDGRHLYVPGDGQYVQGLDATTLEPSRHIDHMRHALIAYNNVVWGLHADRKSIVKWDEQSNRIIEEAGRSMASIVRVAFSPNRRFVCFTRANGQICFGPTDRIDLTTIDGTFESASLLQMSDDGDRFWFIDSNRHLACYSLPAAKKLWSIPISTGVISSLSRAPGSGDIVAGVEDGTVHLLDPKNGARRRILASGGRAVEGAMLLPDKSRLLVVDIDGDVHSFETDGWSRLGLVSSGARSKPYSFAVSPNSRQFAFLTVTGTLHVLRTE